MHKDHIFLHYLMYILGIVGIFLAIIHAIGLVSGWTLCAWAALPLWGNMEYIDIALPSLNIGLLMMGIAMGVSMRNRLGWWIANIMTTVLFSLSFAFAVTWAVSWREYTKSIEIPIYPLMPIIQSFIFCTSFVILAMALLLYLFTQEVKNLFEVAEGEEIVKEEALNTKK